MCSCSKGSSLNTTLRRRYDPRSRSSCGGEPFSRYSRCYRCDYHRLNLFLDTRLFLSPENEEASAPVNPVNHLRATLCLCGLLQELRLVTASLLVVEDEAKQHGWELEILTQKMERAEKEVEELENKYHEVHPSSFLLCSYLCDKPGTHTYLRVHAHFRSPFLSPSLTHAFVRAAYMRTCTLHMLFFLKKQISRGPRQVTRSVDQKNGFERLLIEKRIKATKAEISTREAQMHHVLVDVGRVQPHAVRQVTDRANPLTSKRAELDALRGHFETLDATYRAMVGAATRKLNEFGVPAGEMGFEPRASLRELSVQ